MGIDFQSGPAAMNATVNCLEVLGKTLLAAALLGFLAFFLLREGGGVGGGGRDRDLQQRVLRFLESNATAARMRI